MMYFQILSRAGRHRDECQTEVGIIGVGVGWLGGGGGGGGGGVSWTDPRHSAESLRSARDLAAEAAGSAMQLSAVAAQWAQCL